MNEFKQGMKIGKQQERLAKAETAMHKEIKESAKAEYKLMKEKEKKRKSGFLNKRLTSKRILSKGKRPTVVVNVPYRERGIIRNAMKDSVEQDRRNFFFK